MQSISGGSVVLPGYYLNRSDWQIAIIRNQPAPLPGGAADRFVRVPGPAVLALAPALGLSLVMFVPIAGFAVVAAQAARKTAGALRRLAGRQAA